MYVRSDQSGSEAVVLPYSGHGIECVESGKYVTVENQHVVVRLNKRKGLTINTCAFKDLGTEPILCTLDHGYYDDISLGADFFSGHATIERPGRHKLTDLQPSAPILSLCDNTLIVESGSESEGVVFRQEVVIGTGDTFGFRINKSILLPAREIGTVHPIHFTFNPAAWDRESLYFSTNNGGAIETFRFGRCRVEHSGILSSLISSKHGIGATEGNVIVGDREKALSFSHDFRQSALIPSLIYRPIEGQSYFLRLQYSAQEVDETFVKNDLPQTISLSVTIRGSLFSKDSLPVS